MAIIMWQDSALRVGTACGHLGRAWVADALNPAMSAGGANEVLNERAVAVMKRMSDKLTGRDFLQVCGPTSAATSCVLLVQPYASNVVCGSLVFHS